MMNRLQGAFERFDRANPEVWELFVRFTLELIQTGRTTYSADAVLHRIRWETAMTTTDPLYKLNDHHSAYYARKFHAAFPLHAGFFRTRRVRSGFKEAA